MINIIIKFFSHEQEKFSLPFITDFYSIEKIKLNNLSNNLILSKQDTKIQLMWHYLVVFCQSNDFDSMKTFINFDQYF